MSDKMTHSILEDAEFKELVQRKNKISLILTIVELVMYFGFISLIAYKKSFLGMKVAAGSATTIGIPIAIGIIIFSWILTGIYIFWANSVYDEKVKRIKNRFKG